MIERGDRPPVVYLVQPLLKDMGNQLLHSAADPDLAAAVGVVMDGSGPCTGTLPRPRSTRNCRTGRFTVADDPVLLDVGTPFVRSGSGYRFDQEILLSAIPPGLRAYYRRKGDVATYMDDYFSRRGWSLSTCWATSSRRCNATVAGGIVAANEWLESTTWSRSHAPRSTSTTSRMLRRSSCSCGCGDSTVRRADCCVGVRLHPAWAGVEVRLGEPSRCEYLGWTLVGSGRWVTSCVLSPGRAPSGPAGAGFRVGVWSDLVTGRPPASKVLRPPGRASGHA